MVQFSNDNGCAYKASDDNSKAQGSWATPHVREIFFKCSTSYKGTVDDELLEQRCATYIKQNMP